MAQYTPPYAVHMLNYLPFVCACVCAAVGKRDLINLQSALSPKYIGYANANSPTPLSDSDDTIRTTRRRVTQAASLNNSSSTCETLFRDNASPRSTGGGGGSGAQLLSSKAYMSPIEKLLIKNGANSPNTTGFEADSEDVAIRPTVRKQRKMKRMSKSKVSIDLETETLEEELSIKIEPSDGDVPMSEESSKPNTETSMISIKSETEAEHETAIEVPIKQEDTTSLDIDNKPEEINTRVPSEEPRDLDVDKRPEELAAAVHVASKWRQRRSGQHRGSRWWRRRGRDAQVLVDDALDLWLEYGGHLGVDHLVHDLVHSLVQDIGAGIVEMITLPNPRQKCTHSRRCLRSLSRSWTLLVSGVHCCLARKSLTAASTRLRTFWYAGFVSTSARQQLKRNSSKTPCDLTSAISVFIKSSMMGCPSDSSAFGWRNTLDCRGNPGYSSRFLYMRLHRYVHMFTLEVGVPREFGLGWLVRPVWFN